MIKLLFFAIGCFCELQHLTFNNFKISSTYALVFYHDNREPKSGLFYEQLEKNIKQIEKLIPGLQIYNLVLTESGKDDHNIPSKVLYPYFELYYQQIKVDSIQNVQSVQQLLKWINKKLHHSHQILNDTFSIQEYRDHTRIIVNSSAFAHQLLKTLYHEDVILFYNSTFKNIVIYPAYENKPVIINNTNQLLNYVHPKILLPQQHNFARHIRHYHKQQLGLVVRSFQTHLIDQFIEQIYLSEDETFQYIVCPIDVYDCDQYLHEIGLEQERIPYLYVLASNSKKMQKKHTLHISEIELDRFKLLYSEGLLDQLKPQGINYDGFEVIEIQEDDYLGYKKVRGSELEPIKIINESQFQNIIDNKLTSIIIYHNSRSICHQCKYYETLLQKMRLYLHEIYQLNFIIGEVNLRISEIEPQVYIPNDQYPAIVLFSSKKNPINLTKFLKRGKEDFENILYRLSEAFEMQFTKTTGYLLKQASIPTKQKDKMRNQVEYQAGIDLKDFVKLDLRDDL